jgi:hypothetical protein
MKRGLDFSSTFDLADWLSRAAEAEKEFNNADSSWQTNDILWKQIARKYDLPADLKEFYLQFSAKRFPEDLFDIPLTGEKDLQKYVSQREIKENVRQFFQLRKAWKEFLVKYSPLIKPGELEKLWCLFWGDPETEKWGGLRNQNLLRGKSHTKQQIRSFVKKFGMEEFRAYREILSDTAFMNEIEEIRGKVSRTVSRRSY